MSSLPPFSPAHDDRLVWLLRPEGAAEAIAAAPLLGLAACWLEANADIAAVAAAAGTVVMHRIATPEPATLAAEMVASVRGDNGNALLVAAPGLLGAVVRVMLELPADHGRLVFQPGAVTTVQLLRSRAMLRHLNQGAAVWPSAGPIDAG